MRRELISEYVSKAAKYLIKSKHESYRNMSQKLNLSYGYFRQLVSGNRSLTITDIYEIARLNQVSVSKLFPPVKNTARNFKIYHEITGDSSKQDFNHFFNQLRV